MYQVRFPDGDIYVDRYGRYQFDREKAAMIAQAIGGTIHRQQIVGIWA